MFVWRDFKEDEKLRGEKWEDNIFSSCLVGRGEGKKKNKKVVGPGVFSLNPPKCFLSKMRKKLEEEKN